MTLQLTQQFKDDVLRELLQQRENFTGSDALYAKQFGINPSVFSRLKNGEKTPSLLRDTQWLNMGREFGISLSSRKWNVARTEVFTMIEEDILFCQEYSKARICVDECGIGKTFTAKYLSRKLKNCFYVDASQAKTKQQFVRLIARTIGIDSTGKYNEVKANLKYYLKYLPLPIVIVDEAGDLEYPAFLELKELWNATENSCGWYMMGADGLRHKITKGIRNKKVGYKEIFSRFSDSYTSVVPLDKDERKMFYKKLIGDVLSVNMKNKSKLSQIVNRCLAVDNEGSLSGLRRAESILILND